MTGRRNWVDGTRGGDHHDVRRLTTPVLSAPGPGNAQPSMQSQRVFRERARFNALKESARDGFVSALRKRFICPAAYRLAAAVSDAIQSGGTTRWKSRMYASFAV